MEAARLARMAATWNLAARLVMLGRAASPLNGVVSPIDTPASAHRPFLARGRGRYRLWRWHPNDSRHGTAIIFAIARAIQPTVDDVLDRFSPRPSRGERTKSFGEGERVRWSSSAGSDSPYGRTIGGRGLRGGNLGRLRGEQTAKQ